MCVFFLRFKWLNYANNKNSRPPHTFLYILHMICYVAISFVAIVVIVEKKK